ncbi:13182_t:CDS:2 [Funneliformis caledonium]|uniref:13182_t:CDS:1 n=1 Tax=Funneliformis caledonium TaxID=1117310 RepID=A0A9N9GAB1_9GLOM|nr:13182_t:CDS:2 [Funneliformis caledonium]
MKHLVGNIYKCDEVEAEEKKQGRNRKKSKQETKDKQSKAKLAEALRRKLDIGQANPYFLLDLPIVRNERILLSILSSGSEFTGQQMYHFN